MGKVVDVWYSGKRHDFGGNIQAVMRPDGLPIWVGPVEPGSVHDPTCAQDHALGALYAAAAQGLPTLADPGYDGAGIGQVQADHPVVSGQGQFVESFAQPGLRPPVQAPADRAVRALCGGHLFVAGSVDQSGDDQLEHDPVRDRSAVTPERVSRVEPGSLGTQRGELDEDRFQQR